MQQTTGNCWAAALLVLGAAALAACATPVDEAGATGRHTGDGGGGAVTSSSSAPPGVVVSVGVGSTSSSGAGGFASGSSSGDTVTSSSVAAGGGGADSASSTSSVGVGGAGQGGAGQGGGAGGGGGGAPDPQVVALQDPERASLPYECAGRTLSHDEMVALFDPGQSRLRITSKYDPAARASIEPVEYEQQCNPNTGCSAWAPPPFTDPKTGLRAELRLTGDGELTLVPLDGLTDAVRAPVLVDVGDVIFLAGDDPHQATFVRMRFTEEAPGAICVSGATAVVVTNDVDGTTSRFEAGKTTVRAPLPGSAPDATAPFSAGTQCTDPPATDAEITSAWFSPGQGTALMTTLTGELWQRSCHPQTGCSAWTKMTDSKLSLKALEFQGNALGVDVRPQDSIWEVDFLPLSNGTFAGQVEALWPSILGDVDGHVGLSCAELHAVYSTVADPIAGPDRTVGYERRQRGSR